LKRNEYWRRPTDLELRHVVEIVPASKLDEVEHHLFGRIDGIAPSGVQRVLLACVEPPVVQVASLPVRDCRVVLLDAADDLAVYPLLERRQMRQHRALVVVLRAQVGQHVGVGAPVVAQPEVLVQASAMR
jgi:hypothetical protein